MKDKHILRRNILTILTLLWMVFIFCMSSAKQAESDYQSDTVIDILCTTFVEGYRDLPPEQKILYQDRLTFPVRKCAHMTEYTILGVLLSLTMADYYRAGSLAGKHKNPLERTQTPFKAPLLTGILYACTDEFHQLFVPGRSGELRDVLIDSAGVLIGVLLVRAVRRRKRER